MNPLSLILRLSSRSKTPLPNLRVLPHLKESLVTAMTYLNSQIMSILKIGGCPMSNIYFVHCLDYAGFNLKNAIMKNLMNSILYF
jgi:hypothetical protein